LIACEDRSEFVSGILGVADCHLHDSGHVVGQSEVIYKRSSGRSLDDVPEADFWTMASEPVLFIETGFQEISSKPTSREWRTFTCQAFAFIAS
jgi:hypothetical protein